jgi:hypothetical protein
MRCMISAEGWPSLWSVSSSGMVQYGAVVPFFYNFRVGLARLRKIACQLMKN